MGEGDSSGKCCIRSGKEDGGREKKKLVTFIAGVINVTADIKSKTDRIQIIV